MEKIRFVVLIAGLTLLGAGSAWCEGDGGYGDGNVRVRLVADTYDANPDGSVMLGVLFEIKPGWHIYWHNPGGAGLATEIRWRLPAAFEIGEILWPLPIGFDQSGGIPGYGYEGSVVLATEIGIPAQATKESALRAEVSWLACKGVCVLGSASLEGSLGEIVDASVFDGWSNTLPQRAEPAAVPFSIKTTGGMGDKGLVLWLNWPQAPETVEWFPAPPEDLEVTDVRVQNRGGLTRVDAYVRPMAGASPTARAVNSLVVATFADGERRGWELDVELENK